LPGCFARHCSPPTAFNKRIRDMAQSCTVAETTDKPPNSQRQALLLCQLTVSCSRNGHKLAGPGPDTSAYIPRTGPARMLPIAFPRPHTFKVRIQSVTVVRPQSVRNASGERPYSVPWLSCRARERCIVGLANREFPKHVSSVIRGRAGCPLDFCSPPAAFPSLPVRRTFLLAFKVAFLASSGGCPNLSCRVLPSSVVVLPLGAPAAAPGCVQMLRIFCPVPATFTPSAWPWCARAVPRGSGQPKTESE
jgi:hypothetical protein